MKNIENPFVAYGKMIEGKNFIGRQSFVRAIENRLTKTFGDDKGNMALIGYPRVGKSSIAAQSTLNIQSILQEQKKIPIWINVGLYESRNAFFLGLVTSVFYYFEDHDISINKLERAFESTQKENQSWSSLIVNVQRFFSLINNSGYSIIFILDEFDYARVLFKNDPNAFQGLRDLAYRNFGVNYLTTSRRSIREIEVQSTAISTFDGILSKDYVSLYNADDIDEYYAKFEKIGLILSAEQKSQIQFYCGHHPYLLAVLGYEIVEDFKENLDIDLSKNFNNVELNFIQHYEQLVELLKEDRTFDKLLQILFGPILSVSDDDIKELKNYYGLIQEFNLPSDDKGLKVFSAHFQEYLYSLGRNVDFWALWSNLELSLREVILRVMKAKHKDNWLNVLRSRHGSFFEKAEETRNNAREDNKSENLLDYLDAQPIFEIVYNSKNWNDFKDIFGGEKVKNEFVKKMELIIKIRNPYAHNRFKSINANSVKQAEIYCEDIQAKLNNYLVNNV
jgi:hypothetical protein